MMRMNHGPVSVIIPCYNSARTISRAVKSVLAQKLLPKEIIFIDDKSVDETIGVIKSLFPSVAELKISPILLINEKNEGAGLARNKGWEVAKENYIAFLDSDDSWHEEKLEIQYKFMKSHPEIILSAHRIAYEKSVALGNKNIIWRSFLSLLFKTAGATPTLMVQTKASERFGNFKTSEDRYLILSIIQKQKRLPIIDEVLAFTHKPFYGASGLSSSLVRGFVGDQKVFNQLLRERKINIFQWILTSLFHLPKLLMRFFPQKRSSH